MIVVTPLGACVAGGTRGDVPNLPDKSAIRLIWCADANKVLNETQFGFRKNCKTYDPSSSLACMNAMHDPALQKRKKTLCLFIDFLTVSHSLVWSKLANMGCSLTINMGWIGDLSEFPKRFLEEEECDSDITLILFCSACSSLILRSS